MENIPRLYHGTGGPRPVVVNEYRVAENRMLRKQTPGCVWLTDGERTTVAELGTRFRKKALAEVVAVVNSETLLAWHGKLLARNLRNSRKE